MWILENVNRDTAQNVLRWTFLFAAPVLFNNFDESVFSFIELLIAVSFLWLTITICTSLTNVSQSMPAATWETWGRLLSFLGHILLNAMLVLQIWLGFIISNLVTSMYKQHSSILVFTIFAISCVFVLAVCDTLLYEPKKLR